MQKIGFNEHYGLTTAVIGGTKPMTRRIEPCLAKLIAADNSKGGRLKIYQQEITREGIVLLTDDGIISIHTRYKIDEIVAVAQPYKEIYDGKYGVFVSDIQWITISEKGWNNKLFVRPDLMPHQIQITCIRIERLQDITDDDILKEGIMKHWGYRFKTPHGECVRSNPRDAFACLIDCISGRGTWNRNPWVVVYTFKLVK